MRYVYVDNLYPGMIAADDLYDSNNNIICGAGDTLCTTDIKKIRKSGDLNIPITGGFDLNEHLTLLCKLATREEQSSIIKKKVYTLLEQLSVTDTVSARLFLGLLNHHPETAEHCINVGILNAEMAFYLGLNENCIRELATLGILHDIGKLMIPISILSKKSKLDTQEMDLIKIHPQVGYLALKKDRLVNDRILHGLLEHHERIDGKGYPLNKMDKDLHLYGKITAISDSYEAITAKRSYKYPCTNFHAIDIMRKDEGHYDTNLLDKFEEYILK